MEPMPFLKKTSINNILRNIPFLACLSEAEFEDLGRIISEKRFFKNQIIFHEEDTPHYMYIVFRGKVKVLQGSQDGREHIVAIHKTGDFFGEMSLLDGKTQPATVMAMEETSVGIVTKKDFDHLLFTNKKALREITRLLCSRLRDSWMRLKVLSLANAEHRVRGMLLLMSMQSGIKDQRGMILPIKLTHKDLADYASVSRETVTRLLGRLRKSGEIEILESKKILLKPACEKTLFL